MIYYSGVSQPINPKQSLLCQNGILGWHALIPIYQKYISTEHKKVFLSSFIHPFDQNWPIFCYGRKPSRDKTPNFVFWENLKGFSTIKFRGRVLGRWGENCFLVDCQGFPIALEINSVFSFEKWKKSYGKVLAFKLKKKHSSATVWHIVAVFKK